MRGGAPRTAEEWATLSARFIEDADKVLAIGSRTLAYDNYGYAVEAAAKCMILRLGRLPHWPEPGEPAAEQVYTHSITALIKFSNLFNSLSEDRRRNSQLHDNWLIIKEWFPNRYSVRPPEHREVARLGRAAKGIIAWMDRQ
jgi:HEPN domain-containing protein